MSQEYKEKIKQINNVFKPPANNLFSFASPSPGLGLRSGSGLFSDKDKSSQNKFGSQKAFDKSAFSNASKDSILFKDHDEDKQTEQHNFKKQKSSNPNTNINVEPNPFSNINPIESKPNPFSNPGPKPIPNYFSNPDLKVNSNTLFGNSNTSIFSNKKDEKQAGQQSQRFEKTILPENKSQNKFKNIFSNPNPPLPTPPATNLFGEPVPPCKLLNQSQKTLLFSALLANNQKQGVNPFISSLNDKIQQKSSQINNDKQEEKQKQSPAENQLKQSQIEQAPIHHNEMIQTQKIISKTQMIDLLKEYFRKNNSEIQLNFLKVKQRQVQQHRARVQRRKSDLQEMKAKKQSLAKQIEQLKRKLAVQKIEEQESIQKGSKVVYEQHFKQNAFDDYLTQNVLASGVYEKLKGFYDKTERMKFDGTSAELQQELAIYESLLSENQHIESENEIMRQSYNSSLSQYSKKLNYSKSPTTYQNKSTFHLQDLTIKLNKVISQIKIQKDLYARIKRESAISLSHSALTTSSNQSKLKTVVRNASSKRNKTWHYLLVTVLAILVAVYLVKDNQIAK